MSDYEVLRWLPRQASEIPGWCLSDAKPTQFVLPFAYAQNRADAERIARALRLLAAMEDDMPTTLQSIESLPRWVNR